MSQLECGKIRIFDREFDFFGYTNDTWYQSVKNQGIWNEFTLDHLSQFVAPTDICLDIGANVGTMTLALSMCAHKGHVYAFEASPDTTAALKRTLDSNGLGNASAHNVVVGRQSEKVKFFDMPDVRSSGFYVTMDSTRNIPALCQETFNLVASETKSVDQLVRELNIPRVDFVKIDVEGAELDVLAGANETISRFRPKVIMEFNSYALVHIREIIPRHALANICNIFDEIHYFQDRTGYLIPLPKTESDLETFLHNNLLNGCVDDLLCTFRGAKLGRVFPKGKIINTYLEDAWLSKIPARTIASHLKKRILRRLNRLFSRGSG
jgi:FkbM family methyltransferase